jgi:hypothetical protein
MTPQEMRGLWDLIGQTWGSKFYEQYGPSPNDAWTMALAASSRESAMYSLKKLIEGGSAFAPTLPEFMVFARKWDRDNAPRRDLNGNVTRLTQSADPEKARQNLEHIRAMLKL